MTIYELKREYTRLNPEGRWFDSKTLRFFGDTLVNFRVQDGDGYWVVTRKRAVRFMGTLQGLGDVYHFDKRTCRVDTVKG
mgnify:CR=1 FL=1